MSNKRSAQDMEADSATSSLDQVSKNGDVIFEVGDSEPKTCILVSSSTLTMASPAFAALLGPHFREGTQLSSASSAPITIPLPEDEPRAMADLLRLLHLINIPELARAGDIDRILSFAVAADKWCCVQARAIQCQGIMLGALNVLPSASRFEEMFNDFSGWSSKVVRLAAASYLLEHDQSFADLSKL